VPDELAFILGDSGATVLLFDSEFDAAAEALHDGDTAVRTWLRVGGEGGPGFADDYDDACAAEPTDAVESDACDDDLLFIMYTSGTTGLPKGAVHSHGTMAAASVTMNLTADIRHGDRYLQMLPLFHVGALTPMTGCLHRGCTIVLMRQFDPAAVFPLIEAERVTTGLAVPAMLNFMLASGTHDASNHSTLRWIMSGAAPVPVALIEKYAALGIEIHQVYGLTETCGPACLISPEAALAKAGSTGPAFFHTDVRVVDGDGVPVAPGEVGEVIIRGAHIMREYWNRPDATAETIRDGWLYSGDLATIDAEGFVYIQDRKKDMIITGGENVYPAEIEDVLARHPKLSESAVIGMPSDRWGETPLAVVVVKPGETVTADEVIDFCNGKLARYKIPKGVEFIDVIPRNPTGKILKRLLREQFPGTAPE
jgi:acyl-CoA synthetase (AMP-forming)/AMP-acid ligase II